MKIIFKIAKIELMTKMAGITHSIAEIAVYFENTDC